MKLFLYSVLIMMVVSCKTEKGQWQTLDFKAFQLKAPAGWRIVKAEGIDSYVGGLTNGKDSLWFDYGWYSPEVGEEDPSKHQFARDTINGLIADLVTPINPGDGNIGMYIPINKDDKFSIVGYNIRSTDTILKIFKSIVFEESDTSLNSILTLDKFRRLPYGSGKRLFRQYCISCHALQKVIIGPALSEIAQERSADWMLKFITDRKLVALDTVRFKQKRDFHNGECMQFPDLNKDQVDLLITYLKSEK
jgi:hypothetical protein